MTNLLAIDCASVFVLMALGVWLQSINGKHGVFDELLTPAPLALAGIILAFIEEW